MKKVLLIVCVLFLQHSSYTQQKKDSSFVWVSKDKGLFYLKNKHAELLKEYKINEYSNELSKLNLKYKINEYDIKNALITGQEMLFNSLVDSVKITK